VVLRTGLNVVEKRKYPCPCQESNPSSPVTILTEPIPSSKTRNFTTLTCNEDIFGLFNFIHSLWSVIFSM
jgi:hypothetical protein